MKGVLGMLIPLREVEVEEGEEGEKKQGCDDNVSLIFLANDCTWLHLLSDL